MEDVEEIECVIELSIVGNGNPLNFENSEQGDVLIKNNALVYLSRYSFNFVSEYEVCKKKMNHDDVKDDDCHDDDGKEEDA
jgi:hypothetical protein